MAGKISSPVAKSLGFKGQFALFVILNFVFISLVYSLLVSGKLWYLLALLIAAALLRFNFSLYKFPVLLWGARRSRKIYAVLYYVLLIVIAVLLKNLCGWNASFTGIMSLLVALVITLLLLWRTTCAYNFLK